MAKNKTRKQKKTKKVLAIIFAALFFLAMLGVVLYPMISNLFADDMQSKILTQYEKQIESADTSALDRAYEEAQLYNRRITSIVGTFDKGKADVAVDYANTLNVTGSGVMARIEIPIINVDLPIYHGDTNAALEKGVQHLLGTSLPIGGKGTHAAISAHTGMASQKMFTDLDQLKLGDIFYIHVLGKTLAYQVDAINVVEPYDTSLLAIDPEQDYVTLITCTPYAINTHRLLVRGTRIPYDEAVEIEEEVAETRTVKSSWIEQYKKGILTGLAIVLGFAALYLLVKFVIRLIKKPRLPLNLNKATWKDFTYLPGINTKKAKSMVRYRNKNGDYTAIEDLKKLSWFNDKLFEKVKGKVYVDGDEEKA